MVMIEKVGEFSAPVIAALNLDIAVGSSILLSESTLQHIKTDHSDISGDYIAIISDIIDKPTGVSFRFKDGTIGFFKEYETGIQFYLELSIRASGIGEFFVRTLHRIEVERVEKRMKKGEIFRLDKYFEL